MSVSSPSASPVLPEDHDARTRGLRQFVYLLIIAVAAGAGLARINNATMLYSPAAWSRSWARQPPPHVPFFSANDRSRWCTVWALAERGTYQIDEIVARRGWQSIDTVKKNGRIISTKPPMLATLTAGLYWLVKNTTGLSLDKQLHETVHLLLVFINWVPMLIALGLVCRIAERYGRNDLGRIYVAIAAAVGTMLSPFLITLNNHSIATYSLVFALAPVLRIVVDGNRAPWRFALAGFWAAFTVVNELPAALFFAGAGLLLALRSIKWTVLAYLPAAAVPVLAHFVMNYFATGSLLPAYADYGQSNYNPYWQNPVGIDRNLDSWPVYLMHCLIGHHGILSLSPIFFVTICGWIAVRRWEPAPLRQFGILGIVLTLLMLAFIMSRTENYNYGGLTSGLRWMFWLIPLWLIAMPPAFDLFGNYRWFRIISALWLAASVFSATMPDRNPWQHPWLYNVMKQAGWVDYDKK